MVLAGDRGRGLARSRPDPIETPAFQKDEEGAQAFFVGLELAILRDRLGKGRTLPGGGLSLSIANPATPDLPVWRYGFTAAARGGTKAGARRAARLNVPEEDRLQDQDRRSLWEAGGSLGAWVGGGFLPPRRGGCSKRG